MTEAGIACPACESSNLVGARFCQQCGAALLAPITAPVRLDLSPDDPELPSLEADLPDPPLPSEDTLTDEDMAIIAWATAFAAPSSSPVPLTPEDETIIAWTTALDALDAPDGTAQAIGAAASRPGIDDQVPLDTRADQLARVPTSIESVAQPPPVPEQPIEQPAPRATASPLGGESAPPATWTPPDWLAIAEPDEIGTASVATPTGTPVPSAPVELPDWLFLPEPAVEPPPVELPAWLFLPEPAVEPIPTIAAQTSSAEPTSPATDLPPRRSATDPSATVIPISVESILPSAEQSERSALPPTAPPPAPESAAGASLSPTNPLATPAAGERPSSEPSAIPPAELPGADGGTREAAAPTAAIAESLAVIEAGRDMPTFDYGGAWSFVRLIREQLAAEEAAARAAAEAAAPAHVDQPSPGRSTIPTHAVDRGRQDPAARAAGSDTIFGRLRARLRRHPAAPPEQTEQRVTTRTEATTGPRPGILGKLFRRRNGAAHRPGR